MDYEKILRAYLAHVARQGGTDFILDCAGPDIPDLAHLTLAEAERLVTIAAEVASRGN